jgi:hypothetical protein
VNVKTQDGRKELMMGRGRNKQKRIKKKWSAWQVEKNSKGGNQRKLKVKLVPVKWKRKK